MQDQKKSSATSGGPAAVFCGWGRVLFSQTTDDPSAVADALLHEEPGKRDIAAYVEQPQVVLSYAPQRLFLDPSDMLRLPLEDFEPEAAAPPGIVVRRVRKREEADAVNHLYLKRDMVPTEVDFVWQTRESEEIVFLVAVDEEQGRVLGTVMGIDHRRAFDDADNGSSLWCLAVDPAATRPGIGRALVCALALHFKADGRRSMDLSVIHDNEGAHSLYEQLGFVQVQCFSIKRKNNFNEALFIGPILEERLNPYARIIVDEARGRGIAVEIVDADEGYFILTRGSNRIACRESLSELTNAVAMSRCQDKYVAHRWLADLDVKTPQFQLAGDEKDNEAFLAQHGQLVVKPTMGEQGRGITVGVTSADELATAVETAAREGGRVLLETCHPGQDLRIVVISYQVVAAALRKPPEIVADGRHTVQELIEKLSRRRQAATDGESRIPIDAETRRCVAKAGFDLDERPPAGTVVAVRKTANLHTGGTMEDVTDRLHDGLADAAERIARRLDIPVVGLDFMVEDPEQPEYVFIEANERVGLANHEPQPVVERFVDLLFPLSAETVQPKSAYPRQGGAQRRTKAAEPSKTSQER